MKTLSKLWSDEAGFIISAELVLVATVAVLAMVVGLAEVSSAVNQELEDVGSAVGTMQQSFYVNGIESYGKGGTVGSGFEDHKDTCDGQFDLISTDPVSEAGHGYPNCNDVYASEGEDY